MVFVRENRIWDLGPYFVEASGPGIDRFGGLGRDRLFAV
jgi:hypothetical protein